MAWPTAKGSGGEASLVESVDKAVSVGAGGYGGVASVVCVVFGAGTTAAGANAS